MTTPSREERTKITEGLTLLIESELREAKIKIPKLEEDVDQIFLLQSILKEPILLLG